MLDSLDIDWTILSVADVIEEHFCGPSPDCEARQVFGDAEWGVLKTTAITWSGWDETAHKVLPRSYWGKTRIEVRAGDVLVTKAGPRNRVGVVTHVPCTRSQLVVSGKMIGLRPRKNIVLPEVLSGLLSLNSSQKYIQDRATGMAESQVNFTNDVLMHLPLRIPTMAEQFLITSVGAEIDRTIRQTEAITEKLKQVKQGLLHDLLTRGIDANGELRPPQNQAPHLYKDSPLGWIPHEWDAASIRDVASLVTSGSRGWANHYTEAGALFLRSQNVRMGNLDFSDRQHVTPPSGAEGARTKLTPFDLLITITGNGVGNVACVPGNWDELAFVSQHVGLVRLHDPQIARLAMHFFVGGGPGHQQLIDAQYGQSKPGLSLENLRKFSIPIPPDEERQMIIQRIHGAQDRVDVEQRYAMQLRAMKEGLMDDLLTGRVRVTPLLNAVNA